MVTTYIFFLVAAVCVTAGQVGVLLPQDFGKRSIPQNGGWSLQALTCPSGTSDCGAAWCCPNSLTCVHTGDSDNAEACCPTDSPCQTSLQAAPVCADSSWNLWNTTNDDGPAYDGYTGYLCCLPGQVGSQGWIETIGQSAICVDADDAGAGTLISAASTQHVSTSSPTGTAVTATENTAPTTTGTAASATGTSGATNVVSLRPLSISGVIASILIVAFLF